MAGADKVTEITEKDGTLQMVATVTPSTASNKSVTWTVENGTGKATISPDGVLQALTNGTVTVKATAKDGSGVVGTAVITISGQGEVVKPTPEEAKATFLEGLETAVSSKVAEVSIEEDNITVTFAHDATVDGIKDAANALVSKLLDDSVTGTLTIDEENFNLEDEDVATDVARAILEGTAEDFLNEGSAEVDYTATVTVDGVEFSLNGKLSFKMGEAD